MPALDASQIYSERWDEDEEAVGADQGEDYEDEVDRELENEYFDGDVVKVEAQSPVSMREKRVRIVKRLIERPRTVYERFPGFEKGRVLDFSDLFKGYTGKKSRITKRPLTGQCDIAFACDTFVNSPQSNASIRARGTSPEAFSRLLQAIHSVKTRASVWKKLFPLGASRMT